MRSFEKKEKTKLNDVTYNSPSWFDTREIEYEFSNKILAFTRTFFRLIKRRRRRNFKSVCVCFTILLYKPFYERKKCHFFSFVCLLFRSPLLRLLICDFLFLPFVEKNKTKILFSWLKFSDYGEESRRLCIVIAVEYSQESSFPLSTAVLFLFSFQSSFFFLLFQKKKMKIIKRESFVFLPSL